MGKEYKKTEFEFPIVIVTVGIVIGLLLAFISSVAVHETSDKNFCGMCHTMKPMVDAYKMDVHGGAGKHGMEVKCVDCHLPHDSVASYLVTKIQTGFHDIYAQNFYDLDKIDWEEKRKHREHFVYDSACLACHTNLKEATMSNLKSFKGHRAYFAGKTDKKCVSCHENVGHKNLGRYLPEQHMSNSIKEK
jgi:cytochrome c-type protein NapC